MIDLYVIEKKIKNRNFYLCGSDNIITIWCETQLDGFMFNSKIEAKRYCKHHNVSMKNVNIKLTPIN